jgi:DNA-binding NarL/FixJ family response regulator
VAFHLEFRGESPAHSHTAATAECIGAMTDQARGDRIRIVLLDDHCLFRTSLARLLATESDLDVVGECGAASEALEMLKRCPVDLVLFDNDLGAEPGTTFISAARAGGYRGLFLTLAGRTDAEAAAAALELGASGIFLKCETPDRLVQAIRFLASGGVWVDPAILQVLAHRCVNQTARIADHTSGNATGEREQRVLAGILDGLTNKKIGDSMGLSEGTVKNILQGLFSKTGVRKRSQLVRLALEGSLGDRRQR